MTQTPPMNHYARHMSLKLRMDYNYMLQLLAEMKEEGWIKRLHSPANPTRSLYTIIGEGDRQMTLAKELVAGKKENGKRN